MTEQIYLVVVDDGDGRTPRAAFQDEADAAAAVDDGLGSDVLPVKLYESGARPAEIEYWLASGWTKHGVLERPPGVRTNRACSWSCDEDAPLEPRIEVNDHVLGMTAGVTFLMVSAMTEELAKQTFLDTVVKLRERT